MKHSVSVKLHIRLLCAVLALALTAGILPAWAAETAEKESALYNLDTGNDANLDFEEVAGTPVNWQVSSEGLNIAGDSSVYHSGNSAMYVQKTSLAEKSHITSRAYLPVDPEKIYEFSFWMCSRNAAPTATVRMDLQLYDADGTRIQDTIVQGTVAALNGGSERSGWTKVVTRAAPPEGTAYVSLCFTLTRGAAEVWIDDIFFNVVEDGIDCVVYYEDFHAVDESGNISTWKTQGGGIFTAQQGGRLTVTEEAYIYDALQCLMTDYTYCIKGNYTADIGGTVQVRFYDYQHQEYADARKTVPLLAEGTAFTVNFTAPSHTYAAIFIGSDQIGTITVENVTVYMTAQPPSPDQNYLDADWSERVDRDNVVSSVEMYNGVPTLMIDGQPTAAYFYLRPDLNAYLQTDAESRIAESGLTLYVTYGGSLYKGGCDPIWLPDGTIDYDAFDGVIYDTLAASEDALVMVNIGMFSPIWWIEQNPDHQLLVDNGSSYIAIDGEVSLASEKFRQEAGEVLRLLIRHMKEQNYYNRVFGIKISGGQSYEWMVRGTGTGQGPDYSPVSREGFRQYLERTYGTVEALREAWGDDTVTFETAEAPGWDARCASSNVYMGEGSTLSRNMVDWNLWLNEASADSFLYYCQIAKEETDGSIIVGGYNGYLWTSNSYNSQGMAHTALDRVLDSPYVDWIASPVAYNERLLGQSSTYMTLLDTVQEHGKLYIAEQDNRTCLSDSYAGSSWDAKWDYQIGQTRTMADTLYQQKRDFANALVNGAGLWQYDMYGGWLDDGQIYGYIQDAKAEYDVSVHLDRDITNEVAVFVGDETYAYLTAENGNMSFTLLEPMLMQQRKHLAAMGAGYDTYTMSSLLEGKVPPHKLNIILSPFEITEQMHTAIDTYLKTNDQVVVWVYLPGISTGRELSLSNVERATGFSVGIVEEESTLQVQLAETEHSLTEGIQGLIYGNSVENSVSPLPYIQNTAGMTVLGYHLDGYRQPGLAVKDMGDWTSVYSAAPCLDVSFLRNLMKFAGCHSYSDNSADIIYSSNHYVALHSAAAGEKTINLPGNYSVYDVFEEKFISMNTDTVTYYHQANDTHIFRLMQPNTYTVTASIQSGRGALSAPGITEVTPGKSYSLTVTPETGYQVSQVTVNGAEASLGENGIFILDAVTENTVIGVKFQKQCLIDNGGLEYGSFGGNVTGSGTATVISDGTVHSGLYSLRLNHDGTARDLVEMTVRMKASTEDRTITVSFWAKTAEGAVRALHNGAHFFTENWKKTQNSVYGAVYPSRTQWQQYTQELTLPAGTEIFQYQLYADTANADVYIDDISILCDGTNMLFNGGVERGNLTGCFTKLENTPEVIKAQLVHSGSYAANVAQGTVTATAENLNIGEDTRMALSVWVRATAGTEPVTYRITAFGVSGTLKELEEQCSVAADGQWYLQNAEFTVPAGTERVQVQFLARDQKAAYYLDDIQLSILPPKELEKVTLDFQQIYSDGTWRFTADDMGLLKERYYKIPAVLDGTEGYVIASVLTELICVYPDFFSVYGGKIPTTSFVIPEGAVVRSVDPAQHWAEVEDAEPLQIGQRLEVYLTEAHVEMWNLSLGGDLAVNFHMQLPESGISSAQVVIAVADEIFSFAVSDAPYDAQTQTYGFTVHIAAAQMNDAICVQTVMDGEVLSSESYSVRQYAMYVLADASMSSYHPLLREMLYYGGAAQQYFDYQKDKPANAGIEPAGTAQIPESGIEEVTVSGQAEGLRFYGASLVYREKLAVRFYFTAGSGYTFTANGKAYTPIAKDGLFYVEVADILPQNMDQRIFLTVTDEHGSQMTVGYGAMDYLVRMKDKGSDSLTALLQALYNYHLAAKAIYTNTV